MSLAKYLNRFTTIHHKILTRSTGTPKQLAEELHISESRLLDNLADLKAMEKTTHTSQTTGWKYPDVEGKNKEIEVDNDGPIMP